MTDVVKDDDVMVADVDARPLVEEVDDELEKPELEDAN